MRVRLNVSRLQDILARSSLSQNHWALRMGVSKGHWSDLVNGRHPYPSPKTRQRMVEVLGVGADELFTVETGPTTWHDTDFRAALSDRYLIERELGQGAMGAVYVALDIARNRRVAVKVLAPEAVCGIGQETFLREISAVSRLHHPNILPLFDSGVVGEHPYFVMPWVRGGSLRDRLQQEKRLDLQSAISIARGVASGLTHTHRDFLLHCDVKPANILLHGAHAWLADFGISRVIHAEVSEWRARKGIDASAGTPAYVSPEQALGEPDIDGRTDTYSLGCVVYEMLAGRPPFEGTSTEAIVAQRFVAKPRSLRELVPDLPISVSDVIARAMEVERDRRPETPDIFAEDLANAASLRRSFGVSVAAPALRAIGGVRRAAARRRSSSAWDALWQDVRFATRRLLREPLLTAFILGTLALGIGVNVTAFNVVDRVLLTGPQFVRDPEQLVRFYSRVNQPSLGLQTTAWLPHPVFAVLRDGLSTTQSIGAYRTGPAMLGAGAHSEKHPVSMMSSEMFGVLGVQPLRGRFYGADEDDSRVAVLSESYWRGAFGGDTGVLGRTIAIDNEPHTIVGIAPAGFTGPDLSRVDVWRPIVSRSRNSMNFKTVARIRPGVSRDAAVADMTRLRAQIEGALPRWAQWLKGGIYAAGPLRYDDNAREPLAVVMARWLAVISAIILIISCANVANLLLARLARRRRELAVRVALGSGRMRVVRLLALEGMMLAGAAAIVALAVIAITAPLIRDALFPAGAWTFTLLDARIVAAVLVITLLAAALVSVVPAIQAADPAIGDSLRSSERGGVPRSPLRAALTVVQAMLSVVLLAGAGLFVRSLQRVNAVDLGMQPDRVLTADVQFPSIARAPGESRDEWIARSRVIDRDRYRRTAEAVRQMAGVEQAAVSIGVPFYGSASIGFWVDGRDSVPTLPGGGPYVTAVDDNYFATMGTQIREGRGFTSADRENAEPVAVINATMARRLWPGASALGNCIHIGERTAPCARIVGVVSDLHRNRLKEEPSLQYYVPIGQESGFSGSYVLVRPRQDAALSFSAIRAAIAKAAPEVQAIDIQSLADGIAGEIRPFRLGMLAFGLSAALALIVAALGLYSVMAHAVAWRRREIGVRVALGAKPGAIAKLVVGRGTLLASAGILGGLCIAIIGGRWLEPLLFDTSPRDPVVFGVVVVTLEAVAFVAGWIPARRAMAVPPTEVLHAE